MDNNHSNRGKVSDSIGFFDALFITFLVLKLTGVINWSWWWITSPLWGVALIAFVISFITAVVNK
jgi:hypothetical protein